MSFGDYDVRFDPWQAEYGSEIPLEVVSEAGSEGVDLDLEYAESAWKPCAGKDSAMFETLAFVDGVRRLDARVLATRGGRRPCHGVFGSIAVGVARTDGRQATIEQIEIRRSCVLGAGEKLESDVHVRDSLIYAASSTTDLKPDGPLRVVQQTMRAAEAIAAHEAVRAGAGLVIADGRLELSPEPTTRIVGYVKRIVELYLPERFFPFLAGLPPRTRTPIFAIRTSKKDIGYLSWFLRLGEPLPGEAALTGLVRLELPAAAGLEAARALADATTVALPRFVPPRSRDPRSPQNLLPIGGLEAQLRRRLGDPRLIRRHIHQLLAEEARP